MNSYSCYSLKNDFPFYFRMGDTYEYSDIQNKKIPSSKNIFFRDQQIPSFHRSTYVLSHRRFSTFIKFLPLKISSKSSIFVYSLKCEMRKRIEIMHDQFFSMQISKETHTYIYIYNNLYNLRLRNSLKCEKIIGIDIFEIFEKILLRRFELKLKNLLEQRMCTYIRAFGVKVTIRFTAAIPFNHRYRTSFYSIL